MEPQDLSSLDQVLDVDVESGPLTGARFMPAAPVPIPYSTTPALAADVPKPPGFVKEGRGMVPRSADLDPMYVEFIEGLCTPSELKSALAIMGTDRAMRFLGELCHFERQRGPGSKTIVQAAKKCGIGMDTLAEMWRSHSSALAMMKIVSGTPKLAGDLLEAAANKTVLCPACMGEGVIELRLKNSIRVCPQCDGAGSVVRAGDRDARNNALEWAGVTNQPSKSAPAGASNVFLNLVLPRR